MVAKNRFTIFLIVFHEKKLNKDCTLNTSNRSSNSNLITKISRKNMKWPNLGRLDFPNILKKKYSPRKKRNKTSSSSNFLALILFVISKKTYHMVLGDTHSHTESTFSYGGVVGHWVHWSMRGRSGRGRGLVEREMTSASGPSPTGSWATRSFCWHCAQAVVEIKLPMLDPGRGWVGWRPRVWTETGARTLTSRP